LYGVLLPAESLPAGIITKSRSPSLAFGQVSFAIARDGGRCKLCGKPGMDIDHMYGSSNKMKNLQLLCRTCRNKKTIEGFVPISSEHREKANELRARIAAPKPMRPCDDDERWTTLYPQIQAERQAALRKTVVRG
jgi:hypothetical protein